MITPFLKRRENDSESKSKRGMKQNEKDSELKNFNLIFFSVLRVSNMTA